MSDSTFKQRPGPLSFSFRAGDAISVEIDTSKSLDGYTVEAKVVSLVTGEMVVPFTVAVTDAAGGVVNLSLTQSQCAALGVGTYGWHLSWFVPGTQSLRTALEGFFEVS